MAGNQIWQTSVGTESDARRWGSASSPILYEELVIVPAVAESSAIVALDKKTGAVVWTQEAEGLSLSWSTPIVVKVDDSRSDLVIGVPGEVWGMNPKTGKLRWYCTDIPGRSFYTSVVAKSGVIYGAVGGRGGGGAFAIKAGGKGDITQSHLVWTGQAQNSYATPVLDENNMYFASGGVVTALNMESGERVEQVRLQNAANADNSSEEGNGGGRRRGGMGGDYSSPVIAGDKLYYVKRSGEMFVLTTGDEVKQVAVNRLTSDQEEFAATPAICDGQIFIRSNKHLYCVEEK